MNRSELEHILDEFVARCCGHGVVDFLGMLGEHPKRLPAVDF